MMTETEVDALVERIKSRHRSPEELAKLAEGVRPFDYDEWVRTAPPATPEEVADWEEFLREREAEREESLAREAGISG